MSGILNYMFSRKQQQQQQSEPIVSTKPVNEPKSGGKVPASSRLARLTTEPYPTVVDTHIDYTGITYLGLTVKTNTSSLKIDTLVSINGETPFLTYDDKSKKAFIPLSYKESIKILSDKGIFEDSNRSKLHTFITKSLGEVPNITISYIDRGHTNKVFLVGWNGNQYVLKIIKTQSEVYHEIYHYFLNHQPTIMVKILEDSC